ncbi:MAG: hydrogenase expression/formation protein HypE [Desulfuromonadia bacterium]
MMDDIILLGHGSGGRLSHRLLDGVIIPILSGGSQPVQNDAAILEIPGGRIAYTTDSYVVDPLFFPGGDIGRLAVDGTVNDLAMMGARPVALAVGLIIEEGMGVSDLRRVLESMRLAADEAGVSIVTGDTKVVPRGKGDRLFINTSGIGLFDHPYRPGGDRGRPGDLVIISGTVGDHGVAVMTAREGLSLSTPVRSDVAPLATMVRRLLERCGDGVHVLRDPTRGGVATTLKEIALQSSVDITLDERSIPVSPAVAAVCSLLGLDPLYVANEGKLLAIVDTSVANDALDAIKSDRFGGDAAIIGRVEKGDGTVRMVTTAGGTRRVDMLSGEQLPRIC